MKRQIAVVGGGTAGWLSALYAKKLYGQDADVKLIESEEIGILGAGEGSTAIFVLFLRDLGIDLVEFLREVNGTHKIGVSFENWNGDNKKYIHDFFSTDAKRNPTATLEYIGYIIKNKFDFDEALVSKKLAYENNSPILLDGAELVHHSFHFDAHLVAKYLRKIAEQRGVIRIEGVVSDFGLNKFNGIGTIKLKDGLEIKTDFVFDCSGFARLGIGKFFKGNWISYKDRLTVNTALPFQLPPDTDHIKPYTRAIAMKYGWVWQIPLQNRWGCGYVFDSNYISVSEAKSEVENYFGIKLDSDRTIKFEAGRYNEIWIKNCVAVGLSGTFVEPLEATSIGMTISVLKFFTRNEIDFIDNYKINSFNLTFNRVVDDIVDFLQYHYITNRRDSAFWDFYRDENNYSKALKGYIKSIRENLSVNLGLSIFAETSYTTVGYGLEQISDEQFIKKYEQLKLKNKDIDIVYKEMDKIRDQLNRNQKIISELEYINLIKDKKI